MPYVKGKNGIDFRPPNTGVRNNFYGTTFTATTTGETILSSVLIPSNTFVSADVVDIYTLTTKSTINGATLKLRIGPNQTTGDTQVAILTGATRSVWLPLTRRITISGATNSTSIFDTATSSVTGQETNGAWNSLTTINWTVNNYISLCVLPSGTGITVNCEFIKLKRFDGDQR